MNKSDTSVAVENLSYDYGNQPVLRNLSFSVPRGKFFIIIGPNGSGKTTLLKLISGIISYPQGRLDILGQPVCSYTRKSLAKTIAYVPQTLLTEFPFTVAEAVLMGRSPYLGILGIESQKDLDISRRAMSFAGVEHLRDRKLDQLSGGERQRVFIARAVCQDPQIILLDEPTASLDLAHQIRAMDMMEQLKEEKGLTIIMVSHDVNLAAMYGDSLLLLKDGEIVGMGTPNEVLTFRMLEKAYGCTLLVNDSPLGKFPQVTPVPRKFMIFRD